jgi:signal transduction histidine kinase
VSAGEYESAIDEAIVEMRGLLRTFNALLRISEGEDGARRAGFRTFDLATIAADVAEFYQPLADAKGISLSLRSDGDGLAQMVGDPSLLFEAMANLMDNAIKFMPSGGCIMLSTFLLKGSCRVSVTDTGPGIPVGERETVLRRFHRLERSRTARGSGLGLSLVAAIARLHGLLLLLEYANPGYRVTLRREPGMSFDSPALEPPQRGLSQASPAR